jgi:hypothetical protein
VVIGDAHEDQGQGVEQQRLKEKKTVTPILRLLTTDIFFLQTFTDSSTLQYSYLHTWFPTHGLCTKSGLIIRVTKVGEFSLVIVDIPTYFWAIFSQSHLLTLLIMEQSIRK